MNSETEDLRSDRFADCVHKFSELSQPLDTFLAPDSQKSKNFIDLAKCLFDFNQQLVKRHKDKKRKGLSVKTSLDQLYTTGFDEEQVWQQIQLRNEPLLDQLVRQVADVSVKSDGLRVRQESDGHNQSQSPMTDKSSKKKKPKQAVTSEPLKPKEIPKSSLAKKQLKDKKRKKKRVTIVEPVKKSVVDDRFFKLDQLEAFLNSEDKREEQRISGVQELMSEESDDEIDYFEQQFSELEDEEDLEDGPSGMDAKFEDFFDPPFDGDKRLDVSSESASEDGDEEEGSDEELDMEAANEELDTRDIDLNDIEDNENDDQKGIDYASSSDSEDDLRIDQSVPKRETKPSDDSKSEFELSQEKLREKIAKQERLNMMDKSWQMRGEITSEKRPENSLLEEHLHFDHTQRPAPMITEETTVQLEDVIKQRIKDNAFDDVIRKVKPKEKPFEYRRRIAIESEKSKQSLAEIYENEYLKQRQTEKEEKQNPVHQEIKRRMRTLFLQLDALSNFNFTPRPPQPEVKIINNLPAIRAEEVTPVTASDVSLLAPQEVFNNQKRELQSNAEKSQTDRNRSRRVKKKVQSKKFKYLESKQKNVKSKEALKSSSFETKHLSSSKKFFEKLQEKSAEVVKKSKSEKSSQKSIKQSNKIKL